MPSSPLLRAQSLDNTSPDPFGIGRSVLADDDVAGRERVAFSISNVTGDGVPEYESAAVTIWTRGSVVVARVLTSEKDRAGRGAPIVCHVEGSDVQSAGETAADAIGWFAGAIGRDVPQEHLEEVRARSAEVARKKKTYRMAVSFSFAVALIALTIWLTVRSN